MSNDQQESVLDWGGGVGVVKRSHMPREGGRPRVTGLVVRVLCMWMLEHGSQKDLGGLISFFKKIFGCSRS